MPPSYKLSFKTSFQDANAGQLELLRVLGGAWKRPASASVAFGADADGSAEPPSITVCGDDDQAIYGFRGATIDAFGLFVTSFPLAKRVVLGMNYRSSALIVKASTSVIAHNKGRQPKVVVAAPSWSPTHLTLAAPRNDRHVFATTNGASLPASLKIKMLCCKNAAVEVKQICDAVRKRFNAGASFGHIAVLGRTRAVTRGIALELRRCRVPTTDRNFRKLGERRGARRGDPDGALRNLQHYIDIVVAVDILCRREETPRVQSPSRSSATAALDASFIAVCDTPRRGVGSKVVRALRAAQHTDRQERSLLELALAQPARSRALGKFLALLTELRAHVNSAQLDPATAAAEIHRRSGLLDVHNGESVLGAAGDGSGYSDAVLERRHVIEMFLESLRGVEPVAGPSGGAAGAVAVGRGVVPASPAPVAGSSGGAAGAVAALQPMRSSAAGDATAALGRAMRVLRESERTASGASSQSPRARGAVTVTTIHAAKGREWPIVFTCRWNEGTLPLLPRRSAAPKGCAKEISEAYGSVSIQEERRLAYVAMSRAQEELIISFVRDVTKSTAPSRFLSEIPNELLVRELPSLSSSSSSTSTSSSTVRAG